MLFESFTAREENRPRAGFERADFTCYSKHVTYGFFNGRMSKIRQVGVFPSANLHEISHGVAACVVRRFPIGDNREAMTKTVQRLTRALTRRHLAFTAAILLGMRCACPKPLYLLAKFVVACVIITGHAQILPMTGTQQDRTPEVERSRLCDPASIDGTITFTNQPFGEQTVSLHFLNNGNSSCRLVGEAGHSFAVDGHTLSSNPAICWLCDQTDIPSPTPGLEPGNEILLAPGGRARLDMHWSMVGESCQWADWVSFSVQWAKPMGYLFTPSDWPLHICSAVKSAGYRVEDDLQLMEAKKDGALRVSVLEKAVYDDEQATLHVELIGEQSLAGFQTGCAGLYAVRQGPSAGVRFDPLPTLGSFSLDSYTPEQMEEDKERAWPSWKKDLRRRCGIPGRRAAADAKMNASDLANIVHIEWRTSEKPGESPLFLVADTHFAVLDADSLAPNWGEPVKGVRAGLSIDRMTFKVGERIPLHLRWEDLDASTPVAQGECEEPWPSLEIQDLDHNVLQTIPFDQGCAGHGWGPLSVPLGKALRAFRELTTGRVPSPPLDYAAPMAYPQYSLSTIPSDLPGPGVYYLVSVWSPHILDKSEENSKVGLFRRQGRIGSVYATARSLPVRVEIESDGTP